MIAEDIILRPVLTEKGYDGIADKKYTFVVARNANKTQIKMAVEKLFNVEVKSVNTMNYRGKYNRQGTIEGYTTKYKKAIVKLTDGSKAIEFFSSLT